MRFTVVLSAILVLQGCASGTRWSYTNQRADPAAAKAPLASFELTERPTKKSPDVLVLLALSGGGSRAAYFSARSMLALQNLDTPAGKFNVLDEVGLISSVSGGSLTAAYYACSYDPGDPNRPTGYRTWDDHTVSDLMGRDYIRRWLLNWFWPTNVARFWFTDFDRTDIMAQTFADNFFDRTHTGTDLRMRDLNPTRPHIVLNATVGSRTVDGDSISGAKAFGTVFTFTREDFESKLNSDIGDYELARAVMASATFPAVFNYMTLCDFAGPKDCRDDGAATYLHLFDGGNSDNLGLLSLKRALLSHEAQALRRYKRIVVILVDAYRESLGADPHDSDPRKAFSYLVDSNFIDSTDSLLEANRTRLLGEFFARKIADQKNAEQCIRDNLPSHACAADPSWKGPRPDEIQHLLDRKLFFFHVTFDAVGNKDLRKKLHAIPTSFVLEPDEMRAIDLAAWEIFAKPDRNTSADAPARCAAQIGEILRAPDSAAVSLNGNRWCGGAFAPRAKGR